MRYNVPVIGSLFGLVAALTALALFVGPPASVPVPQPQVQMVKAGGIVTDTVHSFGPVPGCKDASATWTVVGILRRNPDVREDRVTGLVDIEGPINQPPAGGGLPYVCDARVESGRTVRSVRYQIGRDPGARDNWTLTAFFAR